MQYRDRERCVALESMGYDVKTLDNKHDGEQAVLGQLLAIMLIIECSNIVSHGLQGYAAHAISVLLTAQAEFSRILWWRHFKLSYETSNLSDTFPRSVLRTLGTTNRWAGDFSLLLS